MKYVCLVYLVEKDMRAMTKREADACTDESLAYDDALRTAGTTVRGPMPVGDSAARQAFLHDPDGNRLELNQPT